MIDLHIHTAASSDGQHTPEEIFKRARKLGLKAIAFADHNSVNSVEAGLKLSKKYGIEFIPCVELNTNFGAKDLHILAYYIDHKAPSFLRWLKIIKREKAIQSRGRWKKLRGLGFVFDYADVEKFCKGTVPTGATFLKAIASRKENLKDPRVARYISGDRSDSPYLNFYQDFLKGGKPAYVPLRVLTTKNAIRKVISWGGVPVLAHPVDATDAEIARLAKAGLMGLEAYSSYHNRRDIARFKKLAEKLGLLVTCGSDFHGKFMKPNVRLAHYRAGYELFENLKKASLFV
jgi:predicted metal-dependent phosphoesterase TrpH